MFEGQLAELKNCKNPEDFLEYIDGFIATRFTESYFDVTLPEELKTSSTQAPTWCAFVASQIVLGAQVWLGTSTVSTLLSVGSSGSKRAYDKHHIFPKNYLNSIGITKNVDRNQVANFVFIDYQSNIEISDRSPSEYVAEYRKQIGAETFSKSCNTNAIPANLDTMTYSEFLKARRVLMAQMIKAAYLKL